MALSKGFELATLGSGLDVNQSTGEVVTISMDTDVVSEGSSNLYFTNERVDDRVANLLVGGSNITVTYDDTAGTLTIAGQSGYSDSDVNAFLAGGTAGNIVTTGYIAGPATLTIDPAGVGDNTGKVVIAGDLQVDGTQTTINSTTLDVDDLNITVASGAADSAAANGAGLTVDGAGANITYTHATTSWDFNKPVSVTGNIAVSGTVDGVDIAARDGILTSTTTTANAALPKAGGTMTGDISLGDNVSLNLGDSDDASLVFDGTDTTLTTTGELILDGQTGVTIDCNNVTNQSVLNVSNMGAGNTGIVLRRATGGWITFVQSIDHSRPLVIHGTNKSLGYYVSGALGNASYAAHDFYIDANASSQHPAVMGVRSPNNNALLFQGEQSDSTVVFSVDYDGNIATSGTVDGVDIATRDGILTTTTTTANAALPKAGGTITGDVSFTNGNKAVFGGTGNGELEIYASAANNNVYISENGGSGNLNLGADNFNIYTNAFTKQVASFTAGSAKLLNDGNEKLATTATGIDVTGNIAVSGTVDGRNIDTDGTKLDTIATNANNYSHPNHSGEVTSTGDGATVIASDVVDADNLKVTGNGSNTQFLRSDGDGTFTWDTPVDTDTVYTHPNHSGEVTSSGDGATVVASNVIDADNLKVTGNGSTTQFLRSDGDGTFTWATPVDTDTVYTHPNHTGEVTSTGDGATVIANNVVDEANLKVSNAPTNGYFLSAQSGNAGGLTWATVPAGYTDSDVQTYISGNRTYGNITTTGYIAGPATLTIDPAGVGDNTGKVVIAGDLQIDGTTTTINSTVLTVDDKNITLASGAADAAAANGAGITIDGANATITYDGTNDEWDFNKDINVTGTVVADDLVKVTGVGTNTTYSADEIALSGYGLMGNRSSIYITNSNSSGTIDFGIGGIHNSNVPLIVNSTGIDVTGNIAVSGTVDGVDIATRDGILTSTTTTANAALPKAGGTMTGDLQIYKAEPIITLRRSDNTLLPGIIWQGSGGSEAASIKMDGTGGMTNSLVMSTYNGSTMTERLRLVTAAAGGISVTGNIEVSGTVDGRDMVIDGNKLDGIETGATADQTAAQLLTAIKTVDGSSSGLDADTVDGVHASSFIRNQVTYSSAYASDNDTINGISFMRITGGNNMAFSSHHNLLQIPNSGSSQYDVQLAIETDADPQFKFRAGYGGSGNLWSSWREIWHDGNDGAGSGLDADLLDGQQGSYYQKKTTVQDAVPSGATGDFWYESDTSVLHVYYGGAWVDTAPGLQISDNLQINSLGVGTAASGTAGEIRATNDVTAYYSDARLKNFESTIDGALDKVKQLNGYYFTENETAKELGYDNDKRQVGVSAQEVEAVLPEIVTEAPISDEYLTVKYEKLAPLFIEAIKEIDEKYQAKHTQQQAQIDTLMEEIEKLKGN